MGSFSSECDGESGASEVVVVIVASAAGRIFDARILLDVIDILCLLAKNKRQEAQETQFC